MLTLLAVVAVTVTLSGNPAHDFIGELQRGGVKVESAQDVDLDGLPTVLVRMPGFGKAKQEQAARTAAARKTGNGVTMVMNIMGNVANQRWLKSLQVQVMHDEDDAQARATEWAQRCRMWGFAWRNCAVNGPAPEVKRAAVALGIDNGDIIRPASAAVRR